MTIAQSSTEQHIAAPSSSQQHTAAHSSAQQLTAAHSSSQQLIVAHSSADNVHTQPPLKAPETRGGTIQTLTGTHALALARLERRLGAEEARVGVKTVMTAARGQQ
jgi:hypothetical protein